MTYIHSTHEVLAGETATNPDRTYLYLLTELDGMYPKS